MTDIPELPPEILMGKDRNSQRCKRVRAFIDVLIKKGASEEVIAPYIAELTRRLNGNHVGPAGVELTMPRG